MQEVVDPLLYTMAGLGLRELVLVMRELQVDPVRSIRAVGASRVSHWGYRLRVRHPSAGEQGRRLPPPKGGGHV